jgi:hypothetical protein
MGLPYRDFAIWTLSDLAIRGNEKDRITFRGNHVTAQYTLPVPSQGETPEQFAIRVRKFRKKLPRHSDFSERVALAMRALMLDGEKSFAAALSILEILRKFPAGEKAEYERQGIGYAFRPIDSLLGSTRRNHRTKRKKRGISRDEAHAQTIRTQASRFIRKHENFEALFLERFESFRERFRRDAEWYAAAEKSYTARVEAFEKLREPFDWYAAMPLAVAAQLYHEQRKFAQALLYCRKAISAARRAVMHEDFRAFVLYWLRVEMKLCRHSVGVVPMPAYGGPRLPPQETA